MEDHFYLLGPELKELLVLCTDFTREDVQKSLDLVYRGVIQCQKEPQKELDIVETFLPGVSQQHDILWEKDDVSMTSSLTCSDDVVTSSKATSGHVCSVCEKSFRYAKDLRKHIRVHTGDAPFGCQVCQKFFRNKSNLYKHLRQSHRIENVQEHVLERVGESHQHDHILTHSNGNVPKSGLRIRCSQCALSFETVEERTKHVNDTHNANKHLFTCDICQKGFTQRTNLQTHKRTIHQISSETSRENICPHCGESFLGKVALDKHKLSTHKDVSDELCSICGKGFVTLDQLRRHEAVHTNRKRSYRCDFCSKAFFRADILKNHMKIHTEPVFCQICDKKFALTKTLNRHLRLRHGIDETIASLSDDDRDFECRECGKSFSSKVDLKKHISDLHPLLDSGLVCQHCGLNKLKTLYSLKRHLQKHKCPLLAEEECPECIADRSVYQKLQKHIRLNNMMRVQECELCLKKFRTRQELDNHAITHTKEKSFQCDICFEMFSYKSSLQQHQNRHEKGLILDSFPCDCCERVFKTQASYKSHMKSHEKIRTLSSTFEPMMEGVTLAMGSDDLDNINVTLEESFTAETDKEAETLAYRIDDEDATVATHFKI